MKSILLAWFIVLFISFAYAFLWFNFVLPKIISSYEGVTWSLTIVTLILPIGVILLWGVINSQSSCTGLGSEGLEASQI